MIQGDGGGGDGSSGSDESGSFRTSSTVPLPTSSIPTTYDVLRGLGIVGSSAAGDDDDLNSLVGPGRNGLSRPCEVRTG